MDDKAITALVGAIAGFAWIAGFVIAKGFWSTFFCWIPFWAWYLTMEKFLQAIGWV